MRPTLASDQARSATARSSLRTTPPSPALRFLLDWKEKCRRRRWPYPPPARRSRGPGRVLHHLQPVATGDGRHGVQVRRLAGDVHGDDGLRARSHPRRLGVCASIRYVSGRMSQKTGMAPMASTAVAVATKV